MDRLDIRLLRELAQADTLLPANPQLSASHRALAARLGVTAGTVRNRLLKMTRSGLFKGMRMYVNPALLGVVSGSYTFATAPASDRARLIERLADVPGIVFFENFHGPLLGLGVVAPDASSMEALLARIDVVAGCPRGVYTVVHHSPCSLVPNPAEWALIAKIVPDGFRSYRELSASLKVPVRTLKRRISRLSRGGVFLTFPRLDYRALDGGVSADCLLVFAKGSTVAEARAAVLRRVDPWMIFAGVWEEFDVYRVILPNVAVATQLAHDLSSLPGVKSSQLEFVDGVIDNFDRMLPELRSALAAIRRPAAPTGSRVTATPSRTRAGPASRPATRGEPRSASA